MAEVIEEFFRSVGETHAVPHGKRGAGVEYQGLQVAASASITDTNQAISYVVNT